eukprot:13275862-Alexandrium_andersonii.AAC.1
MVVNVRRRVRLHSSRVNAAMSCILRRPCLAARLLAAARLPLSGKRYRREARGGIPSSLPP